MRTRLNYSPKKKLGQASKNHKNQKLYPNSKKKTLKKTKTYNYDTAKESEEAIHKCLSEQDKLCRFYQKGKCKHGLRGKNYQYQHPKACTKLMKYGNKNPRGCSAGSKCLDYHPRLCAS